MKIRFKNTKLKICCVISVFFLCIISNILAFMLPMENIQNNIAKSAKIFEREKQTDWSFYLNSFTDAGMLLRCQYNGDESIMEKAFGGYFYVGTEGLEKSRVDALIAFNEGVELSGKTSLNRYWHGYTFYLKLLLEFLDYKGIRVLLQMIVILLFSFTILTLYKKAKICVIPFICSAILLNMTVMGLSLNSAATFIISMLAIILLLRLKPIIEDKIGIGIFFMMIGMITVWMDLLTTPLLTIAFPLIVYINADDSQSKKWTARITEFISAVVSWIIGYFGFWVMKWFLSAIILKNFATIKTALVTANYRMNADRDSAEMVRRLLRVYYDQPAFMILIIISLLGCIVVGSYNLKKEKRTYNIVTAMMLGMVCFMPFVWCFVLMNHSTVHANLFVYRLLTIVYFAICSLLLSNTNESRTGIKL